MPVKTTPLPKSQSGTDLGGVIAVVLTLKVAGTSSDLVKIALDNTPLPEQVKKTAQTISEGIPDYFPPPRYQQQPSYP